MSRKAEITDFQERLYEATRLIPKGKVTTYKLLAAYIGCESCQAVGQALKRNPFAPEVPCHRVIASDLTIGGFKGRRSGREIREKIETLRSEGVLLEDGKLKDINRLFNFSAVL
jgi:methylated-DNA-[protein]-cysteine S-methyltransferase